MGLQPELIQGSEQDRLYSSDQKKLGNAIDLWKNDGKLPGLRDRVAFEHKK